MKHLDLFSGIGGFALAAEYVWQDEYENVGFCDNDKFSQGIIKKHWPHSKIYDDIKTLRGKDLGTVDLITGGFPCQPFSQAGKQRGTQDDRDLWPEMFRIIQETRPCWIVGENVAGFVDMELERTISNLESEGYEVEALIIPALAVGAPHRRDRVWIIGHADSNQSRGREGSAREKDSLPGIERSEILTRKLGRTDKNVTNPKSSGSKWRSGICAKRTNNQKKRHTSCSEAKRCDWDRNWLEVAAELCRVDDGLPKRLDRASRLKALGNAIVPQVAVEIFKEIKIIHSI